MGRSVLFTLMTAISFSLFSFSFEYEMQQTKESAQAFQFDWNVISDSMMAEQLRTAPFASEEIEHFREARRNKKLLSFLSNNAVVGDTVVFLETIIGLTTKPWELMSIAWIANEKDSMCLYRICGMDVRNNPIFEEKMRKKIDDPKLDLCKSLNKDSLEVLYTLGAPHVFDMMDLELMGTRVVLCPDSSFKVGCITFENFVIPEI